MNDKPLGGKAYGHIPHLPGSRMGPGDHKCSEGQARIATEKARDRHDRIVVTEKLDGSCMSLANINGVLVPLGRAGYRAESSPYEQHQMFATWTRAETMRFESFRLAMTNHRIVGEWLAQAHGTRYALTGKSPWVIFDIINSETNTRLPWDMVLHWATILELPTPQPLGPSVPLSIDDALIRLGPRGHYHALEQTEGCVWRVERRGEFDFMCKYVSPDKIDGRYLPEISHQDAIWNWRPSDGS